MMLFIINLSMIYIYQADFLHTFGKVIFIYHIHIDFQFIFPLTAHICFTIKTEMIPSCFFISDIRFQ